MTDDVDPTAPKPTPTGNDSSLSTLDAAAREPAARPWRSLGPIKAGMAMILFAFVCWLLMQVYIELQFGYMRSGPSSKHRSHNAHLLFLGGVPFMELGAVTITFIGLVVSLFRRQRQVPYGHLKGAAAIAGLAMFFTLIDLICVFAIEATGGRHPAVVTENRRSRYRMFGTSSVGRIESPRWCSSPFPSCISPFSSNSRRPAKRRRSRSNAALSRVQSMQSDFSDWQPILSP